MLVFIALVPWILTTVALVYFLVKPIHFHEEEEQDNDFLDNIDGERSVISVAVYDDKAYWVHENVFYESEVIREPDFTTARPVDTMSLPAKQLQQLLDILDELEEHNNERD